MLNSAIHMHHAYNDLVSAGLRASLLWIGGSALFSDLTTVGTLFALLRYVAWLQEGVTQTSNAYARIMAGMGGCCWGWGLMYAS